MIRGFMIVFGLIVASMATIAFWIFLQIPSDKDIRGCMVTKMYHVNLCPGSKDYVPLRSISQYLQRAVVMSEDASFWAHHGFDWEEMEKSARQNWEKGEYKRGGSTITQQLAKNLFLTADKSLLRKAIEALITMRIEKALNKRDILERYLNVVEFGHDVFGVKAGAKHYFKKSPADLTLAESVFLTLLLPSPEKYARSFRQKTLTPFARQRMNRILSDLAATGKITVEEYDIARAELPTFLGGAPVPATEVLENATSSQEILEESDAPEDPIFSPKDENSDEDSAD